MNASDCPGLSAYRGVLLCNEQEHVGLATACRSIRSTPGTQGKGLDTKEQQVSLYFIVIFFHLKNFMGMDIFFLHICLCTICMPDAQRGQKRWLDPLELELKTDVSCHVGAET